MGDGMVDREKVINGLQESAAYFRSSFDAMYGTFACEKFRSWTDAIEQAIALLKAQEPVKPTLDIRHGKSMWRCGSCSTALQPNQMHAKFCFNCGRAVKWE